MLQKRKLSDNLEKENREMKVFIKKETAVGTFVVFTRYAKPELLSHKFNPKADVNYVLWMFYIRAHQ